MVRCRQINHTFFHHFVSNYFKLNLKRFAFRFTVFALLGSSVPVWSIKAWSILKSKPAPPTHTHLLVSHTLHYSAVIFSLTRSHQPPPCLPPAFAASCLADLLPWLEERRYSQSSKKYNKSKIFIKYSCVYVCSFIYRLSFNFNVWIKALKTWLWNAFVFTGRLPML